MQLMELTMPKILTDLLPETSNNVYTFIVMIFCVLLFLVYYFFDEISSYVSSSLYEDTLIDNGTKENTSEKVASEETSEEVEGKHINEESQTQNQNQNQNYNHIHNHNHNHNQNLSSLERSEPVRYVSFSIQIASEPPAYLGKMIFELFTEDLPRTTDNFITIAKQGYYNGTSFHRVIRDFIVQGGDFIAGDGSGMYNIYFEDRPFEDEKFLYSHSSAGFLSMANVGKDSNGCQSFVTLAPCTQLDGKHVIFGRLINQEGFNILHEISQMSTDLQTNRPLTNVVIESTEVYDKNFAIPVDIHAVIPEFQSLNKISEVPFTFKS